MLLFFNNSLSYLSAYPFSYKIHVFKFAERDHSTDGFSLSPSFPPFPLFFVFPFLPCFFLPLFFFLPSSLSLSYIYLFVMWTFLKKLFSYFWLCLVFCCCTSFFSSCGERGLRARARLGKKCVLLVTEASCWGAWALGTEAFSSCSTWAQ